MATTITELPAAPAVGGYTYTDATGDGTTVSFPFVFTGPNTGYISQNDVFAFFRNSDVTDPLYNTYELITGTYEFPSTNVLTLDVAPAASLDGEPNVRIRRIMDKDALYANVNSDDIFRKSVLTNTFMQQLYSLMEVLDGFGSQGIGSTALNMFGYKIFNLADGTVDQDAVTYKQLQELWSYIQTELPALVAGVTTSGELLDSELGERYVPASGLYLTQHIKVLSESVSTLEGDVSTLEGAVSTLDGSVSLLDKYSTYDEFVSASVSFIDSDHDITISPAMVMDSQNNKFLELENSLTKKIDESWSEGDNTGGLATGLTLAANTNYHLFLIGKDDGTVDAGWDTDINAVNLLSGATGYVYYRWVFGHITDASANIVNYVQSGGSVYWLDAILDYSQNSTGTDRIVVPARVITGVEVIALINAEMSNAADQTVNAWFKSTKFVDVPATSTNRTHAASPYGGNSQQQMQILTDTLGQIAFRASLSSSNNVINIRTDGYIYNMGK